MRFIKSGFGCKQKDLTARNGASTCRIRDSFSAFAPGLISFLANEMQEHKFRTFLHASQQFGIFVSHPNFIMLFTGTTVLSSWWLITLTGVVCRSKVPRFVPLLNYV
jgi:hypothetical protein